MVGDVTLIFLLVGVTSTDILEDRPSKTWPQCPQEGCTFLVIRLQAVAGRSTFLISNGSGGPFVFQEGSEGGRQ